MNVGLVIPAYQASSSITAVVHDALAFAEPGLVLVVDDGSTDGTGDIAKEAGAIVLQHGTNRGKGAALNTGFEYWMRTDVQGVVSLDADGQHLPAEIRKLLTEASAGADLVLGVRDHLFSEMTVLRRRANRISAGLISFAAQQDVPDVQTGFRFYSRRLIEQVGMRETGFEAESAIFVRAGRRGLSVATTPIELGFSDGISTSHYRPLRDSMRIFRAVVSAFLERGA